MTDDDRSLANQRAQVELYGQSLHEIGARLTASFGVAQNRLASLIGISAPMLSQLMSAKRVKIGNPVAAGRLRELLQLADEIDAGLAAGAVARRLAEIEQSADWRSTTIQTRATAPEGDPARAIVEMFREVAGAAAYIDAARQIREVHPEIADLLEIYGAGRADDAREHFSRNAPR